MTIIADYAASRLDTCRTMMGGQPVRKTLCLQNEDTQSEPRTGNLLWYVYWKACCETHWQGSSGSPSLALRLLQFRPQLLQLRVAFCLEHLKCARQKWSTKVTSCKVHHSRLVQASHSYSATDRVTLSSAYIPSANLHVLAALTARWQPAVRRRLQLPAACCFRPRVRQQLPVFAGPRRADVWQQVPKHCS